MTQNDEDQSLFFDPAINQLSCDELCDKIMEVIEEAEFPENESVRKSAAQPLVENDLTFFSDPQSDALHDIENNSNEMIIMTSNISEQQLQTQEINNACDDTTNPLLGNHYLSPLTSNTTSSKCSPQASLGEGESSTERNRRDHITMRNQAKKEQNAGRSLRSGFRRGAKGSTRMTRMCDQITQDEREAMFHSFWKSLKSWDEKKKMFVCSTVDVHFPQRKTKIKHDVSRRQYSMNYFLKIKERKVPVCKTMYLGSPGITNCVFNNMRYLYFT